MKRAFFSVVLAWTVVQTFGQGTVVFNNRVPGTVLTHVWYGSPQVHGNWTNDFPAGTTSYSGFVLTGTTGGPGASNTFAALLGAPGANAAESSLVPSSASPTTFRTGGGAGNIVAQTVTFTNIPADAPVATFQMVVWDNSSGLYPTWEYASPAYKAGLIGAGRSDLFVLTNIGGGTNPAPFLRNLTSFAWGVPEYPPIIQQQPADQASVPGGNANFSIQVLSWNTHAYYQWYFNNSPLGGATNSSLLLSNVQASNFGPYYVTVNDGISFNSRTSVVANLTLALSPSLTNFSVGLNAKFSFRTEVGPSYVVEYKSALTDPAWIQLSTNPGTGGIINVADPASAVASRFYRVRLF
jgi:hypothetical protein